MNIWPNYGYTVAYVAAPTGGVNPSIGYLTLTGYSPSVSQGAAPTGLAAALATVMAGGSVSATGSTITPSLVAARSGGVAPLSVFLDGSGTTAPAITARPFTELLHFWHYGDTSPGTWTNGARTGLSKNYSFGPMGSHVFETAGTFTVRYSVFSVDSSGVLSCATTATWSVTVSAADTVFASSTVCFSNTGNFTGAPSGALQVTTTDFATAINTYQSTYKRMLFQRGETWSTPSVFAVISTNGPGIVGSFGSGALPILQTNVGYGIRLSSGSTPNISDWRIMDLTIDGMNTSAGWDYSGGINQTLALRVNLVNCSFAAGASDSVLAYWNTSGYPGHSIWDQLAIVDCRSPIVHGGVPTGPVNSYLCAKRITFMGNYYDNQTGGEHVVRTPYVGGGVFSNNYLANPAPNKHTWQLHAPEQVAGYLYPSFSTIYADGTYSENIVISNNTHINTGSLANNATWLFYIGPQVTSTGYDERIRNLVIEGSYFYSAADIESWVVRGAVSNVAIRNNVSNTGFATSPGNSAYPAPSYISVVNNTVYNVDVLTNGYLSSTIGGTPNPANITYKNNIQYTPNTVISIEQFHDAAGAATVSNNTATGSSQTSPNFVTAASTSATQLASTDFTLNTGSYAIGAGTYVPGAFLNANWNVRPASINMGAL